MKVLLMFIKINSKLNSLYNHNKNNFEKYEY